MNEPSLCGKACYSDSVSQSVLCLVAFVSWPQRGGAPGLRYLQMQVSAVHFCWQTLVVPAHCCWQTPDMPAPCCWQMLVVPACCSQRRQDAPEPRHCCHCDPWRAPSK